MLLFIGIAFVALLVLGLPIGMILLALSVLYVLFEPAIMDLAFAQRVITGTQSFPLLAVPLFILAIFRYFTLHFNPLLSATLYMVGFQISAQIGNVIMSTPLGALRDQIGYQPTFLVIAGTVLAAGIYAFFTLKKDDQEVLGDPFIRNSVKSAA